MAGTAVAALAAAAVFLVLPLLSETTKPPLTEERRAAALLRGARDAGAAEHAPVLLAAADSVFRASVLGRALTGARFPSFRDFRPAKASFETAGVLADSARAEAVRTGDRTRRDALEAVSEARAAHARAEKSAVAVKKGRKHLTRARLLTHQAELALQDGAFALAGETALEAVAEAEGVFDDARGLTARFVDGEAVERWLGWVDATLAESRKSGGPALLVIKERNELVLYQAGKKVKTYDVDLGKNRLQRKLRQGDLATPEGRYRITVKKDKKQSRYHMALLLDYPTKEDRKHLEEAIRQGRATRGTKLGGAIEIHGEGGRGDDWTLGCVALSNRDIEEIFPRVRVGTPVTIVGGLGEGGTFSRLARELDRR